MRVLVSTYLPTNVLKDYKRSIATVRQIERIERHTEKEREREREREREEKRKKERERENYCSEVYQH